MAYYTDSRKLEVEQYKNIERVDLKEIYGMQERPSRNLGKYLASMKVSQILAKEAGKTDRAKQLAERIQAFENMLKEIYKDPAVRLDFDTDTFQLSICVPKRDPFGFNEMSMGYAAVLDIIGDLILRMEKQRDQHPDILPNYNLAGIVLIDEIETHLHVDLQRDVMKILTMLFPNIQFILTTHSPAAHADFRRTDR